MKLKALGVCVTGYKKDKEIAIYLDEVILNYDMLYSKQWLAVRNRPKFKSYSKLAMLQLADTHEDLISSHKAVV